MTNFEVFCGYFSSSIIFFSEECSSTSWLCSENSDFCFSKAISYIKESSEAISKGQKFTFLHFQNALKFASYQTFFLYSQMEVV